MFETFIALLLLHWIGDFVCQSSWMAKNKSHNSFALTVHVSVYCLVFYAGLSLCYLLGRVTGQIFWFVVANFILHYFIDSITSKLTSHYWQKKDMYHFFVVLGFDQMMHNFCLLFTLKLFLS